MSGFSHSHYSQPCLFLVGIGGDEGGEALSLFLFDSPSSAQSCPWQHFGAEPVLSRFLLPLFFVALALLLPLINGYPGSSAPHIPLPARLEKHPRISCGSLDGPHPASSRARCNHSQSSEVYDLFLVVPNVRSRCPGVELAGLMAYLNIFQFGSFRTLLPR